MWRAAIILVLILGACSPRGPILRFSDADNLAQRLTVFTATTRSTDATGTPGAGRGDGRILASIDISVPPDREPGTIAVPGEPADPRIHFGATDATVYRQDRAFLDRIASDLRALPPEEREIVLYVHGFNNTFAEGVLRLAQMSHDLNLGGVAVHYSWPSAGNPLGYGYDRDSMLFARDGLEQLIRELHRLPAREITLVAHSMGALLSMETMRQMSIAEAGSVTRHLDAVILVSPDIDIDVFRSQARRIGKLPELFAIFVSKRDRALRLSARLTGQQERVGNIADAEALSEFNVVLLDVSAFSEGMGHFTAVTSPAVLQIIRQLNDVEAAFQGDRAGQAGLVPGTVLSVSNLTEIILSPIDAITR